MAAFAVSTISAALGNHRGPDRHPVCLTWCEATDQIIPKTAGNAAISARASEIEMFGLRAVDALHISCAERSSDVMLTTDDEIVRVAIKKNAGININVVNPARWLFDVH